MELIDDFKHFNHFLVMFFSFQSLSIYNYSIHDIKKLVKNKDYKDFIFTSYFLSLPYL